jgi:hypothetical protein
MPLSARGRLPLRSEHTACHLAALRGNHPSAGLRPRTWELPAGELENLKVLDLQLLAVFRGIDMYGLAVQAQVGDQLLQPLVFVAQRAQFLDIAFLYCGIVLSRHT